MLCGLSQLTSLLWVTSHTLPLASWLYPCWGAGPQRNTAWAVGRYSTRVQSPGAGPLRLSSGPAHEKGFPNCMLT